MNRLRDDPLTLITVLEARRDTPAANRFAVFYWLYLGGIVVFQIHKFLNY